MNNQRIKFKLHTVVNPEFQIAFKTLLTDPAVLDKNGSAWALARSQRMITQHSDDFAATKRNLASKLGTPIDGDPKKGFNIPPEKNDEWMATLTPILEQEVELYLDHKVLCRLNPLPANSRLAPHLVQLLDVIDDAPAEVMEMPTAAPAPEPVVAQAASEVQPPANENQREAGAETGAAQS